MKARLIINEIASSKEYKDICFKINHGHGPDHLADDAFQELMIILCEYDPGKLETMYERGVLKWFIVKVLKNQLQSNTSPFYKKLREFGELASNEPTVDVVGDRDQADNEEMERKYLFIETELDDSLSPNLNDWYKRKVLMEFVREESIRKLSKKTDIPRASLSRTINEFRQELINKYKSKLK